MPFASVTIQVRKDALPPTTTWRQDAAAGSVMSFALSDVTGVNSYQWMLWRPEGSASGGAGIEPISLGTSPTANITVDIKGTYIVWCMVNGGATDATIIRGGCSYLENITDPDGRPLRLIGPFETNEDQADPLIQQGIIKMLNRWFRKLVDGGGGGDAHDVKADSTDPDPAFLDTKLKGGANVTLATVTDGGVRKIQITASGGGGVGDVANWDRTLVRFFIVDGDNGDDAHIGYIDAPPGTVFTPTQTGPVAIQTLGRLAALIPAVGATRSYVVLCAPRAGRATYDQTTPGDGGGVVDRYPMVDYNNMIFRGSDLTNSAEDKVRLGMVTGFVGTETDGAFVVLSSGPFSFSMPEVMRPRVLPPGAGWPDITAITLAGAVGSFPSLTDMGRFRLRFESPSAPGVTTATGVGAWYHSDESADSSIFYVRMSPGATINPGDKFWLEEPGVVLWDYLEAPTDGSNGQSIEAAGIEAMNVYAGQQGRGALYTCCYFQHIYVQDSSIATFVDEFADETGSGIETGFGLYCSQGMSSLNAVSVSVRCSQIAAFSFIKAQESIEVSHSQVLAPLQLEGLAQASATDVDVLGGSPGEPPRIMMLAQQNVVFDLAVLTAAATPRVAVGQAAPGVQAAIYDILDPFYLNAAVQLVELLPGLYTTNFDLSTASAGAGVLVVLDQAATKTIPVTWESLSVTGFEIVGAQRVLCSLPGQGYANDILPCPRGEPMQYQSFDYPSGESPGNYVFSVGVVVGVQLSDGSLIPASFGNVLQGVALTNAVSVDDYVSHVTGGYVIVGNDETMVIRMDPGTALPAIGKWLFLSGDPGNIGTVVARSSPTDFKSGQNVRIGQPLMIGPGASGSYCFAFWQPQIIEEQFSLLADDFSTTSVVLANTDLEVTVQAGYQYEFHARLRVDLSETGGARWKMAGTASVGDGNGHAEVKVYATDVASVHSPALMDVLTSETEFGATQVTAGFNGGLIEIDGLLIANTDGTVLLQFAQQTADGSYPSIVRQGSMLSARRVG